MFLSSQLLLRQLLPQTSESHAEILENQLQSQKQNLQWSTLLWPSHPGCAKLSATFTTFPGLGSTETKLEAEAPCGLRAPSARGESPDCSMPVHSLFWHCCTLSTCEEVGKQVINSQPCQASSSLSKRQTARCLVCTMKVEQKQVSWAKAVSWYLSWSVLYHLVLELEWEVINLKDIWNVFWSTWFSAAMSKHQGRK